MFSPFLRLSIYPFRILFDLLCAFLNASGEAGRQIRHSFEELNVLNESFLVVVLEGIVCGQIIIRLLGVIRRQNEPADPQPEPAAPAAAAAAVCRFCGNEYCPLCEEVFKASRWDEFTRNHSLVLAGSIENEEPIREFFKGINPSFVVRFSTQSYYNYGLREEVFTTVVNIRNYTRIKSAGKQV
jgi:hypothetical protein